MNITTELDRCRDAVPGCLTVAYADLSSGLVLCVSSARRQKQEALDALCATAAQLLDSAGADRAAETYGDDPAPAVDEALRLSPGETLAVLRSATDPVEVLCCRPPAISMSAGWCATPAARCNASRRRNERVCGAAAGRTMSESDRLNRTLAKLYRGGPPSTAEGREIGVGRDPGDGLLAAVLTEIDETILARRLTFRGDAGIAVVLRRLWPTAADGGAEAVGGAVSPIPRRGSGWPGAAGRAGRMVRQS